MPKADFTTTLTDLFTKQFGNSPQDISAIPLAGSDRRYLRLSDGTNTVVGAFNPDKKENNTFFYFTQVFGKYKLPVPEIIAKSRDKQYYLLQDLGNTSLFQLMEQEGHTDRIKSLFKKSIDNLVRFHWEAGKEIDYSLCFSASAFDRKQILTDLLYFKYYFADLLKIHYNKPALLEELEEWSRGLSSVRPQTFMYRDFQSRNIQVQNDEVYFIDYQGGMMGLPQYDLASLLWQARAQLPTDWKNELVNYYFQALTSLPETPSFNEMEFRKVYLECVLLRILQTLGAYGFRGLLERKPHFIKSIKPALQQLKFFLDTYGHIPAFSELRYVLEQIVKPEITAQFDGLDETLLANAPLKLHIYSFSYKKGMPEDVTGHGGGFVFDCRGILNPGRFEEYKQVTGKDAAVKEFLQTKTLMPQFLDSVFAMVDISVDDYVRRGFDHLSISFGCTGGQHRSVFAAESLAQHLKDKYGLVATVVHLEQEAHELKRR
ncbi:RapZ C-terminal domain-containing protein [Taibaiella koreensis]|uniref:RapZ C-terminal domain-containing protein n=1 Tax=Taibaiella koreensis TaxID=1268548 RepID=UPI000E59EFF3|nr:RNase adapter RapZ [Taibaiella koreensis]